MSRASKIQDSYQNIRSFSLPRGWVLQTCNLLRELQAGSYGVNNSDRIIAQAKHRRRLKAKRAKTAAPQKRWKPKKKLLELPPYSRAEAYGRRLILQAYRDAIGNGLIQAQAERIARMMSLLIFGKALCGKSVRRMVALIATRGGITRAPIEAFATERSCPHPRQRKQKKAVQRI